MKYLCSERVWCKVTYNVWLIGASFLQDLMPDNDEGEGESTAKEQHHHPKEPPLVFYGERQVLQKKENNWIILYIYNYWNHIKEN